MIFIRVITKAGRAGQQLYKHAYMRLLTCILSYLHRLDRLCYLHIQHTDILWFVLWYTCQNGVYKRGSRPVSRHRHLTIVLQWETGRALRRIGLQLPLVYSHFLSCIKPFWLQGVPLFAVYVDCWLLCGVFSGWNVAHEKVASLIDVQVVKLRPRWRWGWSLVKLNGELRMAARRWSTEVHALLRVATGLCKNIISLL